MEDKRDLRPAVNDDVKQAKCPYCGKDCVPVFYQDTDEGFWSFFWTCNCEKIKQLEKEANADYN